MKRLWSAISVAGALLLAAPCPAAPAALSAPAAVPARQSEPRPALWLLADADTRIYLFGTVHVLQPGLRWRSAALDRAVREARELVLEVDEAEMARGMTEMMARMELGKAVPLLWRVSPDRREALTRLLRQLHIPEGSLDRVQTWAVAMILSVAQMRRDYSSEYGAPPAAAKPLSGVEDVLTREFRADGRPVSGAETAANQLGVFGGLPLSVQQAMLDQAVDGFAGAQPARGPDEVDWVAGNLDGIAAAMEALPPELFDALVTRRNRHFADWLAARLDRPGVVLFAIGAGHFAGRVSVQSMLESQGLHVSRLN